MIEAIYIFLSLYNNQMSGNNFSMIVIILFVVIILIYQIINNYIQYTQSLETFTSTEEEQACNKFFWLGKTPTPAQIQNACPPKEGCFIDNKRIYPDPHNGCWPPPVPTNPPTPPPEEEHYETHPEEQQIEAEALGNVGFCPCDQHTSLPIAGGTRSVQYGSACESGADATAREWVAACKNDQNCIARCPVAVAIAKCSSGFCPDSNWVNAKTNGIYQTVTDNTDPTTQTRYLLWLTKSGRDWGGPAFDPCQTMDGQDKWNAKCQLDQSTTPKQIAADLGVKVCKKYAPHTTFDYQKCTP